MEVIKKKYGFLVVISLCFMVAGLIFIPTKAMAQTTQGDVALKLAELLGFEVTTAEEAVWAIQAVGITLEGGWDIAALATSDFIGSLYTAVAQGNVTFPASLENASALVAAAATAAGMASATVVNAITAAGGNPLSASQGASYSTVGQTPSAPAGVAPAVAPPTPAGPSGGAAGGGGGTPPSPSE